MVNQRYNRNQLVRYAANNKWVQAGAIHQARNQYVKSQVAALPKNGTRVSFNKKKTIKKPSLIQSAQVGVGGHGGTYSSYYYTKRKMPRAFAVDKKALAKNYYVLNGYARQTGTVGQQSIGIVNTMFNYTDINAISQKISVNQTNKFLLKNCSAEVLMTNQDSGNAQIILYDIVARRDLASSANITTPASAWQNSYGDEGGVNANATIVGTTPFSSDLFTQFYKVVKMTYLTLGQGQSHTHRLKFDANKIIDGEYIQYNPNGFKGLTCFTMMVVNGMPYNDTATKTQVSTGNTAIDFIFRKQYSYTWKQDVDTNFSVSNNLPQLFTVNEDIMNEATGAASVDVQA